MRIGIVSNIDNGKGLQRDYELLAGLLREWGHEPIGIHFRAREAPACDLLVFLETLETRFFDRAPRRWFVPNPEWWEPGRAAEFAAVDRVLCKTHDAYRTFAAVVGERAVYTGWAAQDRHDPDVPRRRVFLHTPGDSTMKGTAAVLEAWQRHRIEYPLILVGAQGGRRLPHNVERRPRLDDTALRRLQNECAFHLCPSAYEGYGHTLHEALSVGAAIVSTDAPPMNEIATVAARASTLRTEPLRSATLHHVDPDALARAVVHVAGLSDAVLDEVRADARAEFLAGRDAFLAALRGLLDGAADARPVDAHAGRPGPRLAICLPAHASAAALVRRSVLALRAQTADPSTFEVIIGADGGDPDGLLAAAVEPEAQPFRCRIVPSPRPRGEVPHRNHARNAAWRAAEAPLCWMLDADFTCAPTAVEHILAEHDAALARGAPAVFTTCMAGWGGVGPGDWLARSQVWADGGDPGVFQDLLAGWPERDDGIYNGFPERYCPGAPASEPVPDLHEGMPIVWRDLLNVMGGFDEQFGEWGDDKVECIDRLKGLAAAGLFEIRLITSTLAMHQPHERDPAAGTSAARRRQMLRSQRLAAIKANKAWWRPQVEAARDALPGILAGVRAALDLQAAPVWRPPARAQPAEPDLPLESDEHLAQHALSTAMPRLKGRGPLLAFGALAEAVASRASGREARIVTIAEMEALDAGSCAGVVIADALSRLGEEDVRRVATAARRVAHPRAPVVVLDVMQSARMRRAPEAAGRAIRPPLFYQRLFGGAGVAGHRRGTNGLIYTLLSGRLR